MSFLALDVGQKRIGAAVSLSAKIAKELPAIVLKKHLPVESAERLAVLEIIDLLEQYGAKKIVIGLPYNENGEEAIQAKFIRRFTEVLKEKTNLPIIFEDESDTSSEAEQLLKEQGFTFFEAKNKVDSLAARLILEQYLNRKS